MADLKLSVLLTALDNASGPLKGISAAGKAAARAMKDTQGQLRALDQQSRQVAGLAAQREKLDRVTAAVNADREALIALRAQARAADGEERAALRRQADRLGETYSRRSKQEEALKERLARSTSALRAAGINTEDLAAAQRHLADQTAAATATLRAQEEVVARAVARRNQATAAHRQFARSMERAGAARGAGVGAMAVGGAGAMAIGTTIRAYGEQEDAAVRLKMALMRTGAEVPPEYQKIADLAEHLGDLLPGNTAEYNEMMTALSRQGVSAQTILDGTGESAAHLAVMLKMAPEGAAEFAAKLQDATATASKDMLALGDTIQRVFYLGVDPSNMLAAFAALSPAMTMIRQQGLAGAQTMAPLLAMLDQSGLAGSSGGNALRSVISRSFATDTPAAKKALKPTGLKLDFVDKKGEFKGLDQMFKQLEKLKSLSMSARLSIIKGVWGDDSEVMQALNTMIEKGAAGYREMADKMQAQASEQERINALLGTQKQLWDAATGTFTNLQAAAGGLLAPEIKRLTQWFGAASARLKDWIKQNPELAASCARVAAAAAILVVVSGALLVVFGALSPILAAVRLGFSLLALSPMALGPLAAALGAITLPMAAIAAGAIAVAVIIYRYWGPISNFFRGFWAGLTAGLAPLSGIFATTWGAINAVLQPVLSVLGWVWDKISALLPATNSAGTAGTEMGRLFGAGAAQILVKIAEVVAAAIQLPLQILAAVGDAAGQFAAMGAQMIDGLWSGIKSKAASVIAYVAGLGHQISAAFASAQEIKSPSRVFARHGQALIRGLVAGIQTTSPAALAQIGTLGRGIALAGAGLTMAPLGAGAAPLTTGASPGHHYGGDQISIVINAAPGTDAADIARHIERALRERDHQKTVRRRSALRDLD